MAGTMTKHNGREPDPLAQRLVAHFNGKKETAEALQIHEETLRLWLRDGIPLARALDVERRCEGIVSADEILQAARTAA